MSSLLRFSRKQSTKIISPRFITKMNNRLTDMENRMDECCNKKSATTDSFNSADDTYDTPPDPGSGWVHKGLQGLSLNKRPIKYLNSDKKYDYAVNNENNYGPKIGYEFAKDEVIDDKGEFLTVKMNGKILYLPKKIGTEDVLLKYTFPVGKGIIPVGKGKKTEKIKKKKKTKRKRKSKRKSKGKANEKKAKKQRKSKRKNKQKKKNGKKNGKKKQKIK